MGRYFLNRLRYRKTKCIQWGRQKLADWDIADLKLWMTILESASQNGISLNDVNYTEPTDIGITDACEHGIGGFHAEGVDWRWELPADLQEIFSINLLELVASVVNIWMIFRNKGPDVKILNFTDSSSALGWLFKSCFNPVDFPVHDVVAKKISFITNRI